MKKSRVQISIDPHVLEQFDQIVENRSAKLEELMQKVADMEQSTDSDLRQKKEEIVQELNDVREEKQKCLEKEKSLETELKAVESALEKKEEDSGLLEDAVEAVSSTYEKHRNKLGPKHRRNNPEKAFKKMFISETFGMWDEKISASREEFKEAVKEKVRGDYPEHFDSSKKFKKNLEKRVRQDRWTEPSDIPDYWTSRLDRSKKELWQMSEVSAQ